MDQWLNLGQNVPSTGDIGADATGGHWVVWSERSAWRRWLVQLHMYLGVVLSAVFVMWFASGLVLIFNPYPSISPDERFRLLPRLNCERCVVAVDDALAIAGIEVSALSRSRARLGMLGARPVWRLTDSSRRVRAVYADSAAVVTTVDRETGAAIAGAVGVARGVLRAQAPRPVFVRTLVAPDQWTLEQPLPSQLPLLEYDLADAASTHVYVSKAGAEAVTATTRRGRAMAWIGAIPHWIYPAALRRNVRAWAWVVIVVAGLGTIMCVAGVAIGIWQFRTGVRRVRRDGSLRTRSPYRDPIMRWHHLLGLVFGIVTCTWVFSGLLSVNPGDWSPGTTPSTELQKRWLGATGVAWTSGSARAAWMAATSDGQAVREMQPVSFAGQRYWLVRSDDGSGTLVSADLRRPARVHLPERELVAQADSAMRGVERSGVDLLPVYDDYYRVTLGRTPVLPVLRMRYEDPARTWVYVDPETATLVATVPTRARVERWAYTALHDFDFALLSSQPVLRYAALVVLSLGGMLSSLAGAVLALRWLRESVTGKRSFRRR